MLKRQRFRTGVVITMAFALFLSIPAPPASAMSSGDAIVATFVPLGVVLGATAASYLLYKNRLAQPADAKGCLGYRGPGEFFIGGFVGAGFIPHSTWTYRVGGINYSADAMKIDPGVTGGIKLGYFLESFPYFGVEAEGSIGSQRQPSQTLAVNPPQAGATALRVPGQTLLAWTMAFHLLGRYGFYQDAEVPFGRLQPYVGIGPGLVMLYAEADSAKNFSLELEAGLRYMFTKHFGGFLEYKFSKQWSVELESQQVFLNTIGSASGRGVFDFDRHQAVVGLAYHF
ncbi:outer membrane beta-barrel protein [Desulfobacca acetoxidans]|nr:hypothetical protein [Desulfobacterales bacterium]